MVLLYFIYLLTHNRIAEQAFITKQYDKSDIFIVVWFSSYFFQDLGPEVYIVLPCSRNLETFKRARGIASGAVARTESRWVPAWARALIRSSTSRFERSTILIASSSSLNIRVASR